jgi:hypothetical protein
MTNSEAPAVVINPYNSEPTEYVRRDIFDACKAAVDAWIQLTSIPFSLERLPVMETAMRNCDNLMQAARKAGECVK